MKINEVTPALRVSKKNLERARGNVDQFIVEMDPMLFLKLTTRNDSDIENIMDQALSLLDYNRFTKKETSDLMPFLMIDLEKEKIFGHEGRHRAAAIIKKGGKKMPVGIAIRYHPHKFKYDITFDDLPHIVYGQYGRGQLFKDDMKVIKILWHPEDGDKY